MQEQPRLSFDKLRYRKTYLVNYVIPPRGGTNSLIMDGDMIFTRTAWPPATSLVEKETRKNRYAAYRCLASRNLLQGPTYIMKFHTRQGEQTPALGLNLKFHPVDAAVAENTLKQLVSRY